VLERQLGGVCTVWLTFLRSHITGGANAKSASLFQLFSSSTSTSSSFVMFLLDESRKERQLKEPTEPSPTPSESKSHLKSDSKLTEVEVAEEVGTRKWLSRASARRRPTLAASSGPAHSRGSEAGMGARTEGARVRHERRTRPSTCCGASGSACWRCTSSAGLMPRKASAVNARCCFGVSADLAVCFVRAIDFFFNV
jgi:hypothetical protein